LHFSFRATSHSSLSRKIFAEIFARGAKREHARTERTKILPPSSFSSKIFAEIFAQDKKCADFATGIYKT